MRTGALTGTKASERWHYRAGKLVGENLPKCAACQFGKQINRSKPGKRTSMIKDKIGILSAEQLNPGQRAFINHFTLNEKLQSKIKINLMAMDAYLLMQQLVS